MFVVLYESADDVLSKAPAHFPAHKARLDAFVLNGVVRAWQLREWNEIFGDL
jgi:hypothetical protein